jgi:hypothetical protein
MLQIVVANLWIMREGLGWYHVNPARHFQAAMI